jgi:diguanylate cyclase (GGDEF)-like protein
MLRPSPELSRIFEIGSDPDGAPERLLKVLKKDSVVVDYVNRYASQFYGGRGGTASLERLVTLLGVRGVVDIAAQSAMVQVMRESDLPDVILANAWSDCLHRAIVARKLARLSQGVHPDLAFSAGLALEFGALLLLETHGHFVKWMCDVRVITGPHRLDGERELFGATHLDAFSGFAIDWGLPRAFSSLAGSSHGDQRTLAHGDEGPVKQILYWADRLGEAITANASSPELERWAAGVARTYDIKSEAAWALVDSTLRMTSAVGATLGVPVCDQPTLLSLQERTTTLDTSAMSVDEIRAYAEEVGQRNRELEKHVEQMKMEITAILQRDVLTELPNHAGCLRRLEKALSHANKESVPLSLVIADIDGFGEINLRYGAEQGDVMLRAVADSLRMIVRGNDQLGRIGPDSFVIIVSGDGKSGRLVAERVRAGIEAVRVALGGSSLRVTATVVGLSLSDLGKRANASAMVAATQRLLRPRRRRTGNKTSWYTSGR